MPRTLVAEIIAGQMVRSGTSTGANYRAACRARSRAEFIAKIGVAEEEADETQYWLELFETTLAKSETVRRLIAEATELVAILSASRKTAREAEKERRRMVETRKVDD